MSQQVVSSTSTPADLFSFYERYRSGDLKWIIKRQAEYIKESPYGILKGRVAPFVMVGTTGVAAMLAATFFTDSIDEEKTPLFRTGGLLLGWGVGACLYVWLTEREAFFKAWKSLKLECITNDFVFEKHPQDPFLNQFIDCINYSPLKFPVRLASGHIIDLDTLAALSPNAEGKVTCPHTREELDVLSPNVYLELHCLILKRMQYLLKGDLPSYEKGSDLEKITCIQLSLIEEKIIQTYDKHLDGLQKLFIEDKITARELHALQSEFYRNFGSEPIGNGSEEGEIPPHVMNFDLNWRNILIKNSKIIFRGTPPTYFDEFNVETP